MGKCYSTDNKNTLDYSNFCPLRVASLYADIDESINKEKKINIIVDYFMKSYYGYNLDVFCIQGIHSYRILKEILAAFKKRIEKHNNDNYMGYNNAIYVEYCPDINTDNVQTGTMWNTSELEDEITYYDKIIISRHRILQTYDIQIGTERHTNIKTFDSSLMKNNLDEDSDTIYKYIQIVNINVDGTFVSIYNVELEDDNIGISNIKERKNQLRDLNTMIRLNKKLSNEKDMRVFEHGDNMFIATDRKLHIVTGMFHINAIKNGTINQEYNKLCSILSGFDTHRWMRELLKKPNTSLGISNVRFTKDSYTFIVSEPLLQHQKISDKALLLFTTHKTVIISSNITKNHVDMNQFTNYPEDTVFMLYRPDIELCDNKFINNKKQKKHYNIRNSNNTTQFMDQFKSESKHNTPDRHPKYGNCYNSPNILTRFRQHKRKIPPHVKSFRKYYKTQKRRVKTKRHNEFTETKKYTPYKQSQNMRGNITYTNTNNYDSSTDNNTTMIHQTLAHRTSPVKRHSIKPMKKNDFRDICTSTKSKTFTHIELANLSRYDNKPKSIHTLTNSTSIESTSIESSITKPTSVIITNTEHTTDNDITTPKSIHSSYIDNNNTSDIDNNNNSDIDNDADMKTSKTAENNTNGHILNTNDDTIKSNDVNDIECKNNTVMDNNNIGDDDDIANARMETMIETINNSV
jgi:hypothetical protein